jgi:hypothetical protein
MIEQAPRPQEKEGEKHLRDTAFWAYVNDDGTTVAQIQSLARRRPDLRDRLPHRWFDRAGEDLDARPQVARRPLWCERAGDAREGLGRPESPVVASQKCLAQRWDPCSTRWPLPCAGHQSTTEPKPPEHRQDRIGEVRRCERFGCRQGP